MTTLPTTTDHRATTSRVEIIAPIAPNEVTTINGDRRTAATTAARIRVATTATLCVRVGSFEAKKKLKILLKKSVFARKLKLFEFFRFDADVIFVLCL